MSPLSREVRATAPVLENAPAFVPYLVTVPNVELIEVGEDWETSTGLFTFDEEDLVSCIESQDDPAVRTPVLKLGHSDPRFDGQPAFGRIENLRLSNNQQTLIGDIVGVPFWLAEIMPTAYPRRSFEGDVNATTSTGNQWRLTIKALALLGEAYPAIDTLEDLQLMWGKEPPPLYAAEDTNEVEATTGTLIRARKVEPVRWRRQPTETSVAAAEESSTADQEVDVRRSKSNSVAAATTSLDDVRIAFYDSLESIQYWWWIRSVLVDPLQLVVDDDEGGLYLVDVQVGASGEITFGEPSAVKVEYVAAAKASPPVRAGQLVAAKYETAQESGGRVRASTSDAPGVREEATTVLTEETLRRLGLEPGATDEQIEAAIASALAEDETPPAQTDPQTPAPADEPADPAEPEAQPTEAAPPTEPAAPAAPEGVAVPEGMVLMDASALAELQSGVAASNALIKQNADRERDAVLAGAVKAGKFPRARVDHYRQAWAADPEGTKTLIGQLADGLVPVQERGTEAAASASADQNSYPDSWKPKQAAATAAAGSAVKVARD